VGFARWAREHGIPLQHAKNVCLAKASLSQLEWDRVFVDKVLIDSQRSLGYKHKHEFEVPFIRGAACLFHREL